MNGTDQCLQWRPPQCRPPVSRRPSLVVPTASPACASPSGRRTPDGSAWSGTSIAGTGAATPCASAADTGVWELFIPGLTDGLYKYEIRNRHSGELRLKTDPFAREFELRPATASRFRAGRPVPLAGRCLAAAPARVGLAARAAVDLRGTFWFLAPQSRRQSTDVPAGRDTLVPYVAGPGLYPRRIPAAHRVSPR